MPETLNVLLEKVHDPDPAVRRVAVRELGNYTDKDAIAAIVEALGDPNKGVQNTAVETLSQIKHPNVIEALLPVIRGSDLNTRNAGMAILKEYGPPAVPYLTKSLESITDVDEIIQILVVLGNIQSPLATDKILEYLSHDDDNVKTTAIEALGKIQDPKAVKPLINTYHRTDILKYSIIEALGNIATKDVVQIVLNALESEDVLEYFSAITALGSLENPDCIDSLFKKLLKEEDSGTRRLILKSMAQIEESNPGAIRKVNLEAIKPILLDLLKQSDAAEYIYLLKLAAAIQDEAYVPAFLNALNSQESEIVNIAFEGLLKLGQKAVKYALERIHNCPSHIAIKLLEFFEKVPHPDVPKAISYLAKSSEDSVRQALAKSLGRNPCDTSFSLLKELLHDPDEIVRKNAVISMRQMMSFDGALSAIIQALKDNNGHVRREAAYSLMGSTSRQIEEPLFNLLLTEPYGDVREAAASVLAARKDPEITRRLLDLLESDNSRIRETIAKTIWQCGSTLAVDSLIQKLNDKEWRVVVSSCQSLENLKDLKSIFPLKEQLKNEDWQIRIAALSALRAFKSKELKQFFIPLIADSNPHVGKLAVVALSELEDKSLDEIFRKYLTHPNWEVRYQIVKALGKIKSQKAVDALIKIAESDENNGVRAKALLALAKINDPKASKVALSILDENDKDLVIAAIKFFFNIQNPDIPDLEEKIKTKFLFNPWLKSYFINAYILNKCSLLDKILQSVATPKELTKIDKLVKSYTQASNPSNNSNSNLQLNEEEALLIRDIIAERCGVLISDKNVLEKKLKKNLERFYITSWIEYYHNLKYGTDDQNILISLYDAITDPKTAFFAEPEQNKILVKHIIPELINECIHQGRSELRILSLGCSYGPEPYSIAMSVLEDVHSDKVKVKVTGIDISHICLNTAKRGIYKREMLRNVDQKYIDLYFEDDRGDLRIKDEVKNLVEFKYTNAVNTKEMEALGNFDIVIARNVFSNFAQYQKERLAENIYNILNPGGALFIASKESLYNVTKAFKLQTFEKVVVYRKM